MLLKCLPKCVWAQMLCDFWVMWAGELSEAGNGILLTDFERKAGTS